MLLLINLMVKSPSFESLIPDRHASSIAYRYGFHGQEKNDEVKREGNSLNFKFRMHDPRVGRFLSLDPLAPLYPHNSPYVFSENRVIDGKELEGAEYFYTADGKSLGLVGEKSTEVRIVKAEHIETFSANFNLANKTDEATKEASATALDNLVRNSDAISLSHDEFATIANIIKKESSGDYNETLAIAHTASNRAKAAGKTLFNLLNTTYSSVSSADKVALSEKNTSTNKGARRAVFDVLNGGSDPTNGAQYWDGVDFLAWGPDSGPYNGGAHAKFYKNGVSIPRDILNSYIESVTSRFGTEINYSTYGLSGLLLPNPRFVYEKIADPDTEFFKFVEQTGTFEYAAITGVNKGKITYLATYTQGGTIFWKPVKAYIPEKSEPTWDDYKGNEEDSDCEDID